ncbi:maltase 2-like [Paramacrobiotus metropolitanus]|uniref:maltase 2-like n=1 Tax=Paramacrobiotus metropolitanus TaxID=2943436 RepID=UPI0024462B74|nr:maltase 2-like [Paramacrobiotus metropolitanus]
MTEQLESTETQPLAKNRRSLQVQETLFEHVVKVRTKKAGKSESAKSVPTIQLPDPSKMIYVDDAEQYQTDLPHNGTVDTQLLAPPAAVPVHNDRNKQLVVTHGAENAGYLTRDQLAKYVYAGKGRGWRCLRMSLLLLFWVLLIGLLVATALLVYWDPRRTVGAQWERAWWKRGVIYQVNVKSYQDGNSDGVGDLQGLRSRLEYISQLGVSTVLITPIFLSLSGNSFAVQDFKDIDPAVGTLDDFDQLMNDVHTRNMSLVMDMIVSRTSQEHAWFKAEAGPDRRSQTAYYVWHGGAWDQSILFDGEYIPGVPNAMSIQRSERGPGYPSQSAWEWSANRRQYFLHHSSADLPELDYSNPALRRQMDEVIRFWMGRGVDGIRLLDTQDMIFAANVQRDYMNQINQHQPRRLSNEALDVIRHWRRVMDEPMINPTRKHKLLVVKGENLQEDAAGLVTAGVDLVMNDNLLTIDSVSTGNQIARIIESALKSVSISHPDAVGWALTDYDQHRLTSRMGSLELIDGMNMVCLLLPGSCVTFYGDELGLKDGPGSRQMRRQDPNFVVRGPHLSPMPWSSEHLAGFTNFTTAWLAVLDPRINFHQTVSFQQRTDKSHLKIFQQLARLRQDNEAVRGGTYHSGVVGQNLFSFIRQAADGSGVLVAVDLRKTGKEVQEYALLPGGIKLQHKGRAPPAGETHPLYWADVAVGSETVFKRSDPSVQLAASNATVNLYASLYLRPAEAVVLKFPSVWAENGMAKRGVDVTSTTYKP